MRHSVVWEQSIQRIRDVGVGRCEAGLQIAVVAVEPDDQVLNVRIAGGGNRASIGLPSWNLNCTLTNALAVRLWRDREHPKILA